MGKGWVFAWLGDGGETGFNYLFLTWALEVGVQEQMKIKLGSFLFCFLFLLCNGDCSNRFGAGFFKV